jgi:leader peptidase (prepilin peptidase)/N-methyltransferase
MGLSIAFISILGLAVGSFLNVLVYRGRSGMTLGGRSMCLSCGKTLGWRELIPVFSYLLQRGRCRGCATRISLQYPAVELAAAAVAGVFAWRYGVDVTRPSSVALDSVLSFSLSTLFFWALLAVLVYDARHKIIPDTWVALVGALGLAKLALISVGVIPTFPGNTIYPVIPLFWHFLAGPVLAAPFALIWLISGGRAMGLGDAKLIVALGWFLGISGGLTAVIVAFWIATVPSVYLLLRRTSGYTMKSEIPFGPFLIFAAFLVAVTGFDLMNFAW